MNLLRKMSTGKAVAYLAATLGAVVSIAANIGHSFKPPSGAAPGWHPPAGAVLLAAFWPVALLLAIEVLARVEWPETGDVWWKSPWVYVRWVGVTPVALVAAIVSYRHLSGLLDWYNEDQITVYIGPLAVDGLMVVATGALVALVGRQVAPQVPAPDPKPAGAATTPPEATPDPVAVTPPPHQRARRGAKPQVTDRHLEEIVKPLVLEGKGRPTAERALREAGLAVNTTALQEYIREVKLAPVGS